MRPDLFLATIGRGSNGSNALEVTEDRAAVTAESQDNIINRVNNVSQYGPSWHYVPGIGVAGTAYAEVPGSALGDLAFTRASSKTRTNSAGVVETIASNVPPHDYRNADGTLSTFPRLNLEPQRTNSIRNSSMVGAVAGSPGTLPTNWAVSNLTGLTQTVVGTGVENGLPYIDIRYNGTSTTTNFEIRFETSNQIAATNGQIWTFSHYVKVINGTFNSANIGIIERTSVGGFVAFGSSPLAITSTLQRFAFTRTLAGGATVAFAQPLIAFTLTNGAAYDFTIRIAAPQMELGAYATTWVPTTTAAVTRLADAFTRNNIFTNGLISAAGGTWFVEISDNASVIRDNGSGLFIGDTAFANNGNQIIIRSAAPAAAARFSIIRYISGTATTLHTTTTNKIKIAVKWNGSVIDVFVNGVKVSASNLFTTTNMQNLIAGAGQIFEIDQMALENVPLSDAQCIQMTTL